ncbi:hypothetical protein CEW92_09430 [Bacillaceae bacterium SAS-127]|nr:hypothetical protein CEW92_09430 [Bacillaceae bacterium SAS-127]
MKKASKLIIASALSLSFLGSLGTTTEAASVEPANNQKTIFPQSNVVHYNMKVGWSQFLSSGNHKIVYGADVVSINSYGRLTALKPGKAQVNSYLPNGTTVIAIYTVTN